MPPRALRLLFAFLTAVLLAPLCGLAQTTYRSIPLDCGGWFSGFAVHSSGTLYGFGDVFGMWRSNDAGQTWTYLLGDQTTNDYFVNACAVSTGNADRAAYLSGFGKAFVTTDGGTSWTSVLSNMNSRRDRGATPLVYHPADDSELWVASRRNSLTGSLWRSTNHGTNWTKVGGTTFDSVIATSINIRPEFPNQIWVGAVGGLYVSPDRGATWTRIWDNTGGATPLYGNPPTVGGIARRADGLGYMATNTKGWRISATNYADPATYTVTATVSWWDGWGPSNATVLADGSFLTNTADNNFARSTDGALSWQNLPMKLLTPPTPPWSRPAGPTARTDGARDMVVQDPTQPARWFATGGIAPVITTDSGLTWRYPPRLNGIAGVPTTKVRFPRLHPTTALIPGADQGVFTVTDGGFSGDVANSIRTSIDLLQTHHEVISSADGLTLVAAGTDQGPSTTLLARSTDGGYTWTRLPHTGVGLPASYEGVTRAIASPTDINDFLVLLGFNDTQSNNNPGLYRTTDGGASFTKATGIPDGVNTGARYFPSNSWLETDGVNTDTRYLSLRSQNNSSARGFYRSTNGGSAWAKTSAQPFGSDWIHAMAVDPTTGGRVWVAGSSLGLKRSDNGGDTWSSAIGSFTRAERVDAHGGRVAVWGRRGADTWNKVYSSLDNGTSWTELTGPSHRYSHLSDLAVDPIAPHRIWLSGISVNVINPPTASPFIISPAQAPTGTRGQPFSYTLLASTPPTTWTLQAGSLPPGLTLTPSTGSVDGTPTVGGVYPLTLTATGPGGTTPPVVVRLTITTPPDPILTGTVSGSAPWAGNSAWDAAKVFDGNLTTFFAPGGPSSTFAQLDLGASLLARLSSLRYHPRSGQEGRMANGRFQGSTNGTTWTTLHTISGTPPSEWTQVLFAPATAPYRYFRYFSSGLADVTEVEFRGLASTLLPFRIANALPTDGSGDLATPAGDGTANLLKYAFNLIGSGPGQVLTLGTPHSPTLTPEGSVGLPLIELTASPSPALRLTYVRRKATTSPGITYTVEFASDLAAPTPWAANASATETVTSLDATWERVTVTDSLAASPHRFARLRVSLL